MTKPPIDNVITAVLLALTVLILCTACESRTFTAQRPDGTVITYNRISVIGDSSSEGVSVSKQGDDLTVDVGPTGSQAKVEVLGEIVKMLK